jgi:hypothetical protein
LASSRSFDYAPQAVCDAITLRSASLRMTGLWGVERHFQEGSAEPQISPLRYAPVEMTSLFGNAKRRFQDELSSRPERSAVEGSAVCLLGAEVGSLIDELDSDDQQPEG